MKQFISLKLNDEKIKVPSRIGHGYIPIEILPIDLLHTKYSKHRRLRVFHEKGLKCVNCEKVGYYLILGKDRGNHIHADIYTKDFQLMTIDHIKPRGKGGSDDIENLDPMCESCNSKKADKYEDLEG